MAIIKCPKCGKDISDKAKECPKCGWKTEIADAGQSTLEPIEKLPQENISDKDVIFQKKSNNKKNLIVAGIIAFLVIGISVLLLKNYKLSSALQAKQEESVQTASENQSMDYEEEVQQDISDSNEEEEIIDIKAADIEESQEDYPSSEIIEFSGTGDMVVPDVNIPEGIYRVHLYNRGESNFIVHAYDGDGTKDPSWANEVGNYSGYIALTHGFTGGMIEVKSSGEWFIKVLPIEDNGTSNINGTGDAVSPYFYLKSGLMSVELKNSGDSNFIVHLYDEYGNRYSSLANEIGNYEGQSIFNEGEENTKYFLQVQSEGEWTVNFNLDKNVTHVSHE